MKRRLLAAALSLGMVLGMAACGNDSSDKKDGAEAVGKTETGEKAGTGEKAETGAKTDEGEKRNILLGVNTYLTGGSALLGQAQKQGCEIAVKQINEAGGVNGHMLELICYDNQLSNEKDVQNITRMIEEDHVDAICNNCISSSTICTIDITEAAKVLQVNASPSMLISNISDWTFRPMSTYDIMNAQSVQNMVDLGFEGKTVGMIYYNTDTGLQLAEFMAKIMEEEHGMTVIADVYNKGDTDFSAQFSKMLNGGAETIFLCMDNDDMGLALQQIRRLGYDGVLFATESASAPMVRENGEEAANDVIYTTVNCVPDRIEDASTEIERKFLQDYYDAYGELPQSDLAYRGYDMVMLYAEAFGNVDDIDDKQAVRDAYASIKDYEGIQGAYDFTQGSDGLKTSKVWAISDGKNMLLADYLADKE